MKKLYFRGNTEVPEVSKTFVKRTYFDFLPDLEGEQIRQSIESISERAGDKIKAVEWYRGLPLQDMEYDAAALTTGTAQAIIPNKEEDSIIQKILKETPEVKSEKFLVGIDIVAPFSAKKCFSYFIGQ